MNTGSDAAPDGTRSWVAPAAEAGTTTAGLITMVTLAAKAVSDQGRFPEIDVPVLSDLNPHLDAAKGHANLWIDKTSGDLWREVQSLIRVGSIFRKEYTDLRPMLLNMANDTEFDTAVISQVANKLAAVHRMTAKEGAAAKERYGDIRAFSDAVRKDFQTFSTDYDNANAEIGSESERLRQLRLELNDLHTRLSNDGMTWGFGASAVVIGTLVVCVGLLLEFPTAGTSTAIVATGAAIITAGGVATVWGAVDQVKAQDRIAKVASEIATYKHQLALIESAKGLLGDLGNKVDYLDKQMQNVLTAWQDLDSGLDLVVSDLQRPEERLARLRKTQAGARPIDVAAAINGELTAADGQWERALPILEGLLDKGRNMKFISVVDQRKRPTPEVIAEAYARAA